jgi:hypothetical protein
MELLFRHSALILVGIVLLNGVIAQRRIPAYVAGSGGGDEPTARRFVWRAATWLVVLFLAMEGLMLASGARSPLCLLPQAHPVGQWAYVAWTLSGAWTLVVVLWVWVGNGAELTARYGPLFARNFRPELRYNPQVIRLIALLWAAAGLAMPFLFPSTPAIAICP